MTANIYRELLVVVRDFDSKLGHYPVHAGKATARESLFTLYAHRLPGGQFCRERNHKPCKQSGFTDIESFEFRQASLLCSDSRYHEIRLVPGGFSEHLGTESLGNSER